MAYTIKDILQMEVAPALGCTDPAAVALATAAAASLLPNRAIDRIELWLDPNIYKNGFAVSIPGTQGESGIDLSAALGAFGGDPQLKLEVLEPITTETLRTSKAFVAQGKVLVHVLDKKGGIYIRAELNKGKHTAGAVIQDVHDNIVSLSLDGRLVKDHPLVSKTAESQDCIHALE